MVRSMTGFGRGEATGLVGRLVVEAKAVNHRFSEVVVRMPRQIGALEERIRKMVQAKVSRGRVDVFVQWEQDGVRQRQVKVDKDLALAYYSALKELALVIGSNVELSGEGLSRLPDVLTVEESEVEPDAVWPFLQESLERSLLELVSMREREGQALVVDLIQRIDRIAAVVQTIAQRSPLVVDEYRQRLQRRCEELLPDGTNLDPSRLAQEVVIFADKTDVTEELKRLGSHLAQFRGELTGAGGAGVADEAPGAVGRKLDFLVQEMNREINTIGSKAQDVTITGGVVEVKTELERIREQVQNIE